MQGSLNSSCELPWSDWPWNQVRLLTFSMLFDCVVPGGTSGIVVEVVLDRDPDENVVIDPFMEGSYAMETKEVSRCICEVAVTSG